MLKKKLFCFLFVAWLLTNASFCLAKKSKKMDIPEIELTKINKILKPEEYTKIYNELPILDIMYINSEDPVETYEYDRAMINSPYALVRIPLTLNCRTVKFLPGEYLLKASSYNAYDFVMFKQNGKISGLVPVYKKQFVGKSVVKNKEAKLQYTKSQKRKNAVKKVLKFPIKWILHPHSPKHYAIEDYYSPAGEYLIMNFYYDDTLYKMIFAVEKAER